jgi:signal transduction histidine kinase/DNA-binding NarL/FixJ family response regulator/HPt (histidine-containing phosphotransfer) domain-containing protein
VPIPRKSGSFLVTYGRDLREIRAKEKELRKADMRTRVMLDATPLACILLEESGGAVDCNTEAVKLYETDSKENLIEHFDELMPECQPDGALSVLKKRKLIGDAIESGYGCFEWEHLTLKGESLPTEITLVRVEWNNAYSIAAYIRDLRAIRAEEERTREANKQRHEMEIRAEAIKAASEAKNHFLASMSHEIRTPMNAIIGMSELMRIDNLDDEQTRYFTDIRKMSYSLLQIINDILDFSKIEADKMDLIPVHYNIFDLFYNICSIMRFTLGDKPMEFHSSIADDIPLVLYGDETRMRQITTNLVNNAVKYTREGYVDLRFRRELKDGRDYLSIRVEDSGIGIKKENFDKIFGAFEQVDNRKNTGIMGTGLGLSITKQLVEMMGGEITLESEYGKGSVFTAYIPLVEGDPDKVRREDKVKRAIASPDVKVLVVDDNDVNLTVAVGFLSKHGIKPETTTSGESALKLVRTRKYDLIFMDHMMPGMDGIEATKLIRAMGDDYYERVPIIALSANAVSGIRETFIEAGMNDFVSKPIKAAELNEVLLRWLPPEKLINEEATNEEAKEKTMLTPENDGFDELLEQLSLVEDLNVSEGLARVDGNRGVYVSILRQFCKGLDKSIESIRDFAAQKEWKEYSIRVHSLKSVLASFGNQLLSTWALALEKASASGETEKCERETESFCKEMHFFRERLMGTSLMEKPSKDGGGKKIPVEELLETLENLSAACLDCDANAVDAAVEILTAAEFRDDLEPLVEEICEFVECFEYEEAVNKCSELKEILQKDVLSPGSVPV